ARGWAPRRVDPILTTTTSSLSSTGPGSGKVETCGLDLSLRPPPPFGLPSGRGRCTAVRCHDSDMAGASEKPSGMLKVPEIDPRRIGAFLKVAEGGGQVGSRCHRRG